MISSWEDVFVGMESISGAWTPHSKTKLHSVRFLNFLHYSTRLFNHAAGPSQRTLSGCAPQVGSTLCACKGRKCFPLECHPLKAAVWNSVGAITLWRLWTCVSTQLQVFCNFHLSELRGIRRKGHRADMFSDFPLWLVYGFSIYFIKW